LNVALDRTLAEHVFLASVAVLLAGVFWEIAAGLFESFVTDSVISFFGVAFSTLGFFASSFLLYRFFAGLRAKYAVTRRSPL
jgi:hypothetical protein